MSNPHELISLLEDTRAQIETLLTRPSVREGVYVSVHGEQARAEEKAAKRLYKQKVPRAERRAIRADATPFAIASGFQPSVVRKA